MKIRKITAGENKVFRRIHDGFVFGNQIHLGMDFSTGTSRKDKREYYEEIDAPPEESSDANEVQK